ncbi:peptide deformylase [Lachnospiraceae bacterium oral taxon 500]|nr:peptide deformylase [Lachnospiraceae bacterium oral taxon 500]
MALRNIRIIGDEVLRKRAKEVKLFNQKLAVLVEDMVDTMYESNGVGLAAPQVGVLKRVFVIDVGDGVEVFINPEIIETSEETQKDIEGCLSIPGERGYVIRPQRVKVRTLTLEGKERLVEAEGLFARAICHENDHLNGQLYIDIMEEEEVPEEIEGEEEFDE